MTREEMIDASVRFTTTAETRGYVAATHPSNVNDAWRYKLNAIRNYYTLIAAREAKT